MNNDYQDLIILKALLTRSVYDHARDRVPEYALARESKALLAEIDKVYREVPDLQEIAPETLKSAYKLYPNMDQKNKDIYCALIDNVAAQDEQQVDVIIQKMIQLHTWDSIVRIWETKGLDREAIIAELDKNQLVQDEADNLTLNLDELYNESNKEDDGVRWNLDLFNDNFDSPLEGQFYVVGAGPNVGKTAMLVDMAISVAMTLPDDKQILWINNEEPKKKVIDKWMARACGTTTNKINEWPERAKEKYKEVMKREDRILYIDSRQTPFNKLIDVIKSRQWGLIIVDLLSNIAAPNSKQFALQCDKLESVYKIFRGLSQEYGTIIAGCQAKGFWVDRSGQKHYLPHPDQEELHGTNIGIQGAAENIIMIGCEDPQKPIRNVRIAKSKNEGCYQWRQCRFNVSEFKYED